ncbi:MAG: hypothetical protein JNK87_15490 [Bryobacterales bacterium]|nr:hypothetical protein [Bryobacterales bacterium]
MALNAERVPFRWVNGSERDESTLLLIASAEIPDVVAARAVRSQTLVVGSLPRQLQDQFQDAGPENLVRSGDCYWWRTPIGEMLTGWLREESVPEVVQGGTHLFQAVESNLPDWVRLRLRTRQHQGLQKSLWSQHDPSSFPVDVSGLLQLELLKTAIRQACGYLVRLERWPAGCRAAAVLTQDLDSRETAEQGLRLGLGLQKRERQPVSIGLSPDFDVPGGLEPVRDSEVYCLGEFGEGEADNLLHLREPKERLERRLGRRVLGFRAKGLRRHTMRNIWLDHSGYAYSSSVPDVDRETASHFGAGVRWNLPFRPPVCDGFDLRESRCLEIPVSAPSCIEPLFSGAGVDSLRQAVTAKLDFLCETGGIFCGLSRSGSFGMADAQRRFSHLHWMAGQIRQHRGFWLTTMDQAATWWRRREQVTLSLVGSGWVAENKGSDTVAGLRLVVEDATGRVLEHRDLPALAPGAQALVDLPFSGSEGLDYEAAGGRRSFRS